MSTLTVRRSSLGMACALALTMVGAVPAEADLARCSNCIVAADIATNGVGRAEIGVGAVAGSEIADRSIGIGELAFDPATQAELDATVNPAIAPPTGISSVTVATNGPVHPSAVLGVDGRLLIASYASGAGGDIWVTHCTDIRCSTATSSKVVTGSAFSPALTIGRDGLGLIAYRSPGTGLRVAHCVNIACTSVTTATVDSGNLGYDPSIAIGGDGLALIAYQDGGATALKVAHCANVACTASTTVTVDGANDVGWMPAIAAGVDGFGIISHIDETNDALRIVHCTNITCSTSSVTVNGFDAGRVTTQAGLGGTDIAILSDGLPMVVYRDTVGDDLQSLRCANLSCSSIGANPVLDGDAEAGTFPSIAVGSDGMAVVASYESTSGSLRVTHCGDIPCFLAKTVTAATGGLDTSIAIDANGLPIVFVRRNGVGLVAVRCPNVFCAPFFRH